MTLLPRLAAMWRGMPRIDRFLIATLIMLDAAGLAVTVLLTGVQRGDWMAVAVLCPLLVAMVVTHLLFYRWQVNQARRAPRWGRREELVAEIVDRSQQPVPRLPDPFRRRRMW